MTNLSELIHRYRWTTVYLVYVVYIAVVFQLVGMHR